MLKTKGIEAIPKQLRQLTAGVQTSLVNNEGKGIERVGEGQPARWKVAVL
jgi:hypothetical protein